VLRAYSITIYGLCTCAQPASWPPDTAATGTSATGTSATGSDDMREAGP
jgi:hypothetical protein